MITRNLAIGVDIGGTKIAIGLIRKDGAIVAERIYPTANSKLNRLVDEIRALVNANVDTSIRGIGIGAPGPLNSVTGIINNPHTLPLLSGINLIERLRSEFNCPVRLENDADAALLGEVTYGAARGANRAVMLTFGTGVGGAAWMDGHFVRGAKSAHPEIGHIPIHSDDEAPCYCGARSCLESLASGTAINHVARRAGFLDSRAVFAAAATQDARALGIVEQVRAACQAALWTLIHSYHPEVVIFGGGVMQAQYTNYFSKALDETSAKAALSAQSPVRVVPAQLGNRAGMIGAAALTFNRETPQGFEIRVFTDHESLSQAAAQEIRQTISNRTNAVLCLPTGETPTRTYQILSEDTEVKDGSFAQVRAVQLDEWGGLAPNHPASCAAYLQQHAWQPWGTPDTNRVRFSGNAADPEAECQRIADLRDEQGSIDLCILGLGANGHLALNEPGDNLNASVHVARLAESSSRHSMLQGIPNPITYGLTLGLSDILRSRKILLLVSGKHKFEIFKKLREGKISTQLPASLLWTHPHVVCLCDQAAFESF